MFLDELEMLGLNIPQHGMTEQDEFQV